MIQILPLHAVNNSFKDNWILQKSTIRFVKRRKLGPIVALGNAERISELKVSGMCESDIKIKGLKNGMKVFGFDPEIDATNHIEREFNAPSGREMDW